MPAPRRQQDVRRGPLLHGMLWIGVALAPLAILVLMFGTSVGALRVAVGLSVLTVVLVGASVALRPSVELLRVDIEERVLDEVEQIRLHARHDVAVAARNTHQALTQKIMALADAI